LRFFEDRKVARTGAHRRDFAFTVKCAVAPDANNARGREVFGFGRERGNTLGHFGRGARQQ
jgi:hypothetical protein